MTSLKILQQQFNLRSHLTDRYWADQEVRGVYFITSYLKVDYSEYMLLYYLKSHLTEGLKRIEEQGIS